MIGEVFLVGVVDCFEKTALSNELLMRAGHKAIDKAVNVDLSKATPEAAAYAAKKAGQGAKFMSRAQDKLMDSMKVTPADVTDAAAKIKNRGRVGKGLAAAGVLGAGALAARHVYKKRRMEKQALSQELMDRAHSKAQSQIGHDGSKFSKKRIAQTERFGTRSAKPFRVAKPGMKMPSKLLGLGAAGIGVMGLGALALNRKRALDQPPKPARY